MIKFILLAAPPQAQVFITLPKTIFRQGCETTMKTRTFNLTLDKPDNLELAHKTYYVGGETKDMIGSYMLLENSSRAFVVYIPCLSVSIRLLTVLQSQSGGNT
ncbi:hypothetical protein N9Y26_00430 [bacterium]|nr:hypothetical protein [bacterium]